MESGSSTSCRSSANREVSVAAARETLLVSRVRDELARLGIELAVGCPDSAFILTDLSGLNSEASSAIVRELHLTGHTSLSIWKRGAETFLGPWTEPLRSACWNCSRLRFSDLLAADDAGSVAVDPATIRAVVENVVLALWYPQLTAFGCVLVDDGDGAALHSVVPMPWCTVCGGAAKFQDLFATSRLPNPLVPEELSVLADARGGVLRRLLIFAGDHEVAPTTPVCASAHVGPYAQGDTSRAVFTGEGKGATQDAAVRSAIGEGVERYSASLWNPSDLTRASLNELGSAAFDPRWLVLYDERQYAEPGFPFAPFDPDLPVYWTEGRWLATGDQVQLPALAAYMHFTVKSGEHFAQMTSNGLAAGVTAEDATLRALYELIERDAFMLYWLARRAAVRIAPDGCDAVTQRALSEVERLGARTELYVLDVGTGHPTVVCLGLGDGRSWPGATIGLAAHADIDIALQRAALEHGHCGAYIRRLMLEGRHEHLPDSENVLTGLDHALYYVSPARAVSLEPLRAGAVPLITLADLRSRYRQESTLSTCVACLQDAGIRTAAVDVTSPDVALAPMRVVRAFGTHMQPIHFGSANRRLASPRLRALLVGSPETEPHPVA